MKHLKIRGKLTLGFGFLLIILIVMNAFSLSNLRSISGLSVDLYTGPHMSAVSSVALIKDVHLDLGFALSQINLKLRDLPDLIF